MINIRQAEVGDAPAIMALMHEVHEFHATAHPSIFQPPAVSRVSLADVTSMIERDGALFVVATRDGAFAGYARAEVRETVATALLLARRSMHVIEMAVAPAHRRRGVGRALLNAVRGLASERGATNVSLEVYAFNAEARGFYAREGFNPMREVLTMTPDAAPKEDSIISHSRRPQ